ncbi:hypothetical protein D3C81_1925600 [compost metagenome]
MPQGVAQLQDVGYHPITVLTKPQYAVAYLTPLHLYPYILRHADQQVNSTILEPHYHVIHAKFFYVRPLVL